MAQQQSLFGPSIYDIQQQQMQQDQANALAQARLTPYQSIRAGMGMAGTQAGRSIAGLFGVEDPQLKQASAREELKRAVNSQWDGQDPVEAYRIMAREASRLGLTQEALTAAAQVKQAEEAKAKTELGRIKTTYEIGELAARTQKAMRQATEAMQSKAPVVQLQRARQDLRDALQNATTELEKEEIRQQITEIESAITLKTTRAPKEEKQESFGVDREAISKEKYGKRFGDLTQQEQQAVNKRVLDESKMRQPNTNITLSTPENAALIGRFETSIKPIFDKVSAIDSSVTLIKKGTPFSEAALRQEISSIFGDANKAKTEIEALANTGSLDQRIANRITQFINGKDTKVTNEDRLAVLLALREKEKAQYERRRAPYVSAAKASNVNATDIFPSFEAAFGTPPGVSPGGAITGTTSTGTEYRVVKRGN
jgi:hypothetical protein